MKEVESRGKGLEKEAGVCTGDLLVGLCWEHKDYNSAGDKQQTEEYTKGNSYQDNLLPTSAL